MPIEWLVYQKLAFWKLKSCHLVKISSQLILSTIILSLEMIETQKIFKVKKKDLSKQKIAQDNTKPKEEDLLTNLSGTQ